MKTVTVRKRLIGEDIDLGEGATIILDKAVPPMIGFLRLKYLDDQDCLEGDIEHLFLCEGKGLEEKDYWWEF